MTLQTQREYPPNMLCKDKFLVQSSVVPSNTNVDELPQDTVRSFNILIISVVIMYYDNEER